jgi:hypothetical protein
MKVPDDLLDELIEHGGLIHGEPLEPAGVVRIALDLRDTRKALSTIEAGVEAARKLLISLAPPPSEPPAPSESDDTNPPFNGGPN